MLRVRSQVMLLLGQAGRGRRGYRQQHDGAGQVPPTRIPLYEMLPYFLASIRMALRNLPYHHGGGHSFWYVSGILGHSPLHPS